MRYADLYVAYCGLLWRSPWNGALVLRGYLVVNPLIAVTSYPARQLEGYLRPAACASCANCPSLVHDGVDSPLVAALAVGVSPALVCVRASA